MSLRKHFHGGRLLLSLAVAFLAASIAALAPTASAMATTSQGTASIAPTSRSHAVGDSHALTAVVPNIVDESCTSNRSTWVHVYPQGPVGTFCLGFKGTWVFNNGNGRWVNKVTFGNNYGSMYFEFRSDKGLVPAYLNFDGEQDAEEDCTAIGGCLMLTLTIDGWH